MKKKLISVLLCAAMAGTMLAGCGGGGDDKTDSAAGTGDAKQEDTAKAEDTGDSGDGKSLVYWAMWDAAEPQAKVVQAAVDKYVEDTGVQVDLQFKGRNGQREGLEPALAAGQTIDLFDEDVNRVNGTWGKYLLDMEDLAKDYEAKYANPILFKIARTAGGDTLKSIPYQPSLFGFFYNKDLFDKAGIKEAPKTWAEFDAVCKKLKDAGITPITGDDAYMTCWTGYHLGRYVGQEKVKEIVMDGKWDDPSVLKTAQDLSDFAEKGYFSENIGSNVFPAGQNTEFAVGTAAIILDGSWLPNEIKDTAGEDFKYGYFNYPTLEGGKDDNTANNIANQVLAINKDSKMSKEAFELITYITTGDFDQQMTEEALCIPADKNNTEWPAQLEAVKPGFDATKTCYNWAVDVESNNDVTPAIKDSTTQLLAGSVDAQGFVDALKSASGQ